MQDITHNDDNTTLMQDQISGDSNDRKTHETKLDMK